MRCERCNRVIEVVARPGEGLETEMLSPTLKAVLQAVFKGHCNACWSLICHKMTHLLIGRLL